ncbi:MAG: cysteine synthase A [Thermodesulfobacteriota bacterium]
MTGYLVGESVGHTPLLRLARMGQGLGATILVKQESRNPVGSVKDRLARAMIDAAMASGEIGPATTVVEPTSGNTGIGLAMVCASRGLKLLLAMPESMSMERRRLLLHLGAQLELTPAAEGMAGAVTRAREMAAALGDSYIPDQFNNPVNPAMHRATTGQEIVEETGGRVDLLVVGVGTGGTISGVGEALLEVNGRCRIVAVEPAASAVLSGGKAGTHRIQGIGAGFVPANLNEAIVDEVVTVTDEAALTTARDLARQEGILAGISSGAALWAAMELAARGEYRAETIVTILPDSGERYLSTDLFLS